MKEIRILLENCDTITADGKDVKFLDMEHISKLPQDINIICQTTGQICTTDRVTLILSKDANLPHREFGVFDETTVFKRLMKRRDIVALTIVYDDGKEITYHGSYEEKDAKNNFLVDPKKSDVSELDYHGYKLKVVPVKTTDGVPTGVHMFMYLDDHTCLWVKYEPETENIKNLNKEEIVKLALKVLDEFVTIKKK